jgi:hypothetical protein
MPPAEYGLSSGIAPLPSSGLMTGAARRSATARTSLRRVRSPRQNCSAARPHAKRDRRSSRRRPDQLAPGVSRVTSAASGRPPIPDRCAAPGALCSRCPSRFKRYEDRPTLVRFSERTYLRPLTQWTRMSPGRSFVQA